MPIVVAVLLFCAVALVNDMYETRQREETTRELLRQHLCPTIASDHHTRVFEPCACRNGKEPDV